VLTDYHHPDNPLFVPEAQTPDLPACAASRRDPHNSLGIADHRSC
jgi:hypothetical protein